MIKRKPTIYDLMITTGFGLVLCAIPIGFLFALEKPLGVQPDLRWEIITGCAVTVSMGITGGVLMCIGGAILRRRFKNPPA